MSWKNRVKELETERERDKDLWKEVAERLMKLESTLDNIGKALRNK